MTEELTASLSSDSLEDVVEPEIAVPLRAAAENAPILLLGRPGGRFWATAEWMRARGHDVYEAGTPLEAISVLQAEEGDFGSLFVVGPIDGVPSLLVAEAFSEVFPELRVVPA